MSDEEGPKGSVVIDGCIFPVVRVFLHQGMFVIQCVVEGPHKSVTGRYRLHSDDGQLVYFSDEPFTTPQLAEDSDAIFTILAGARGSLLHHCPPDQD